ncbi:uncharacterized protein LOC132924871 [Rhopalosiphum padi]|uniref:uncharacterized protein LOC132924871 n=1 Tax=Rhopalosiphum padi TaxID=40932 RepID=UPI00298DDDDD|nr:uncharacterized protein LOC132924871 [Rhopalosiphum padi]
MQEHHETLIRNVVIICHIGLYLFDNIPLTLIALGLLSHIVYYFLLIDFPNFNLTSLSFILSIILLIGNHVLAFKFFRQLIGIRITGDLTSISQISIGYVTITVTTTSNVGIIFNIWAKPMESLTNFIHHTCSVPSNLFGGKPYRVRTIVNMNLPLKINQKVFSYFTVCLWMVPFMFILSLSANDNTLPITNVVELFVIGKVYYSP